MSYEELMEWAELHGENYPDYEDEEDFEVQAEMDEQLLWNI